MTHNFTIYDHNDGTLTLAIGDYTHTYLDPVSLARDLINFQQDPSRVTHGGKIRPDIDKTTAYSADHDIWTDPPTSGPMAEFLDEYMQQLMSLKTYTG